MKIIHTSDLHLGSPLSSKLPRDKSQKRRGEIIDTFSRLTKEASRLGASAIIIAGDLFDSGTVSLATRTAVRDIVTAAAPLTFIYLPGNHDAEAISVAGLTELDNFTLIGKGERIVFPEGVTVSGLTEGGKGAFSALGLDAEQKNIVVMHGELRESASSAEHIPLLSAAGKNIDYLALGHYHSYSATSIDSRGVAVYSGTPEGRGFDEPGECGFVLIDTDSERISHRFIPFARRTLHIVKLPLDGIESQVEIIRQAREALSGIPKDDLVRLTLTGHFLPELWVDTEYIQKSLEGDFYYFELRDESRVYLSAEEYKNDKSLKGEFIRMVMADTSLDEETKSRVISCGIGALMKRQL